MYFYLNVYLLFYIRLKFVLDSPVTHTHITIFIIKTIFLRENKDVRNISIFFFKIRNKFTTCTAQYTEDITHVIRFFITCTLTLDDIKLNTS